MSDRTTKTSPRVSVVIPTRNRWAEVQRAVESCLSQDYPALEILMYDDASEENLAEKLQQRYPTVKTYRSAVNVGQLVLRNRGFLEATGKYIISLDDDAFFNDNSTISKVVEKLERYPDVAVIALPYYEPRLQRMHWQGLKISENNTSKDKLIATFVASAAAFRKQAVLSVKGYDESLFFQGEESDLSIRLMEKGFDIISSNVTPLIHTVSEVRNFRNMHINGPRNAILFIFSHAPWPFLVPRLLLTTLGTFWHGVVIKEPWLKLIGIFRGYRDGLRSWRQRRPVTPQMWRKYRRLLKRPEDYVATV